MGKHECFSEFCESLWQINQTQTGKTWELQYIAGQSEVPEAHTGSMGDSLVEEPSTGGILLLLGIQSQS
jgi:hypothetical protein